MNAITDATAEEIDRYRYGWRDISTKMPDGTVRQKRIALTPKDCLYPEEGDFMTTSSYHSAIIQYLASVLELRLKSDPGSKVLSDCKIFWGHPDIGNHGPDVAVIFGVRNRDRDFPSFTVADEGVKPTVIIEVVSLNVRDNDVIAKVDHYHRLEIPFYVIVDQDEAGGSRSLIGYRYTPTKYVPVALDENGWLWVERLNIWMEAMETSVVCYDGETLEPLLGLEETTLLLEHERAETERERELAERERELAEWERKRAEREAARAEQERANTEREKSRADAAEAELAALKAKLADH